MKRLIALCYLFFGIVFLSTYPLTTSAQAIDEITQALQLGSSKTLGKYLQDHVSLNVNNTLSDYSRNQAEQILRDFFRKNPPKEFKILHQDEAADNTWHFIGQYLSDEASFKVLVKGAKQGGGLTVSQIDFTKE